MLKRNMILLFAFAAIAGSINAQVRPGIKLGYNLSGVMANYLGDTPSTSMGNPDNFRMKSGFQAGLIADCPINNVLAIQPGARFALQGFSDKYDKGKKLRSFSMYYLQIPVNVQCRWKVYEETNVLFQAGPYIGFGLFGQQAYHKGGSSQKLDDKHKKITFGNGKGYDVQNFLDYGVGAGVGIEFYRFQLMLAYDFGLNQPTFYKNAQDLLYNIDMRNHNFSVTLAFIFGRKDPLQNQKD